MEFENLEKYKESVIKKELEDSYSLRKTCYTFGSTKEIWACKFSRRNDCNRKRVETDFIIDTGTLREEISKISKEPVDLSECFVCYSEVIDDVEGEDSRFCIIWTSKQLQARVEDSMTQYDCTYRLTWQVCFLDCLFNWTNDLHYFSW